MTHNKLFHTLFGGLLLFGAAACTDEIEYTPADPVAGEGVYFSADADEVINIKTDATETTVILYRSNAEGTYTASLESTIVDADGTDAADIFDVPASVTFADGATEAPIKIGVTFNKVVPLAEYVLNIKVKGNETTPYGLPAREFIITYAPWGDAERYGGKDEYAVVTLSGFGISGHEVPVFEEKSLVSEQRRYIFGGVGMPGYEDLTPNDKDFYEYSYINGYNVTVIRDAEPVNAQNPNIYLCTMPPVATGDDSEGSMIMITDVYTYRTQIGEIYPGNTPEQLRGLSYYNAETGLFTIYTIYYDASGPLLPSEEYMQLPGFKSYTLEFSYTGNYVSSDGKESAIIEAYRSDDLASFAYVIKQGALDEAGLNAAKDEILANTDLDLIYDQVAHLSFSPEESGLYTIVGVGYDTNGKNVCQSYEVFSFESVQKEKDWQSIGMCEYTDGAFYGLIAYKDGTPFGGDTWDVEVEESIKEPGHYRLVNPYASWPTNVEFGNALSIPGNYYLYFNATKNDNAYIVTSDLGIDLAPLNIQGLSGACTLGSRQVEVFLENGNSLDDIAKAGWCGTNDNGLITFPAATLILGCGEKGAFYANQNDATMEAFENNSFSANLLPTGYGVGILSIDMSVMTKAPARSAVNRAKSYGIKDVHRLLEAARTTAPAKATRSNVTKLNGTELMKSFKFGNTVK